MELFDKIAAYIESKVNFEETLVILTADHSHAFELVGQPGRFQNVLGLDQYYSNEVRSITAFLALGTSLICIIHCILQTLD